MEFLEYGWSFVFFKNKGNAEVLSTLPHVVESLGHQNKEIINKKRLINVISVVDRSSKICVMRLKFNHLKEMKQKILTF